MVSGLVFGRTLSEQSTTVGIFTRCLQPLSRPFFRYVLDPEDHSGLPCQQTPVDVSLLRIYPSPLFDILWLVCEHQTRLRRVTEP